MDAGTLAMPRRALGPPPRDVAPPVSNTRIAMLVVIAGETMLFAGLVGMYLVFRLSRPWPPPDLPRLPLPLTTVNTFVLLASAWPMTRALRATRRVAPRTVTRGHRAHERSSAGSSSRSRARSGSALLHHGLTLGGSMYGATFYVLIGCHGAHVLIALAWVAIMAAILSRGRLTPRRRAALEMCGMYWYFVCALWLFLFPLVYLY
jgi:heme/copper-type cytochrome/quinol oxidase subunit 3